MSRNTVASFEEMAPETRFNIRLDDLPQDLVQSRSRYIWI